MSPLERLLNLMGLLLDADRPMTFEEIREKLDAYAGDSVDASKRKFERDKDILREYGVPLVMADIDVWGVEQGYLVPKDEYYLPEIGFTPEEITALFVAAQDASEQTTAVQGVRKLLYGSDGGVLLGAAGGPLIAGSDSPSDQVMAAAEAASTHRRTRFEYRSSQGEISLRDVDVYALVFRGGRWYLVGFDHDRQDVRAFRLSRFTGSIEDVGEGAAPPEGFSAREQVTGGPWDQTGEEVARVAFDPDVAILAESAIAGTARERDEGSRVVLAVPFADQSAIASAVLQFGVDAEVLEPASLRKEVVRRLEGIVGA